MDSSLRNRANVAEHSDFHALIRLCNNLDDMSRTVKDEFSENIRKPGQISDTTANGFLSAVDKLQTALHGVRDTFSHHQDLVESLEEVSRTDPLTSLLNRRAFDHDIARRIAEWRRSNLPLSLMMVDIDNFKVVNDTYGHLAGDKVLRGVANVLRNSLREMDVIARFGGEEFAILLPSTNIVNACRVAERVRTAIGTSIFQYDEYELAVTSSLGVATATTPDPSDFVRFADQALYAAKRSGRNTVFVFDQGSCKALDRDTTNVGSLKRRRWLRFMMDDIRVRIALPNGSWRDAEVVDESISGIGLRGTAIEGLSVGDLIKIEYCGDVRAAEVKCVIDSGVDDSSIRIGLQWTVDFI